jgi:hypothetical protein
MDDRDPDAQMLLDRLASVAADLLSQRRYRPFLRRLLSAEREAWRPACELCDGMEPLPADAPAAFKACGDMPAYPNTAASTIVDTKGPVQKEAV